MKPGREKLSITNRSTQSISFLTFITNYNQFKMLEKEILNKELRKGEKSNFVIGFNRKIFLSNLHTKYSKTKKAESKS